MAQRRVQGYIVQSYQIEIMLVLLVGNNNLIWIFPYTQLHGPDKAEFSFLPILLFGDVLVM